MKLRVFLFEDNETVREAFSEWLTLHGHDVIAFPDADRFCSGADICLCGDKEICGDVLLCDVNLPGMTGLELMTYLKQKKCRIPNVALMSGWWTAESRKEANKLGFTTFRKPVDMAKIFEWVTDCETSTDADRTLGSSFSKF